jgi:hypothetical protein
MLHASGVVGIDLSVLLILFVFKTIREEADVQQNEDSHC